MTVTPAIVTPMSGTESGSTARSSASANVSVPTNVPEDGLLQSVAVPQPHEPGRERLRRHLDDQHAERDHEAGEPTIALTIALRIVLAIDSE